MRPNPSRLRLLVLAAFAGPWAATAVASADMVVIGTGDPAVDVPAVQAAVDAGGVVRLEGVFSFDVPATDERTVLVTTGVVVEGIPDAQGRPPVIVGGVKPFQVNAPGEPVAFRRLRFAGARLTALEVRAADGVAIEGCRFDGVVPQFASAIGVDLAIGVVLGFFTAGQVVGDLSIVENHFDIGGTAADRSEAIVAIGVGSADRPAALSVRENVVRNTVAHGIDIRNVVGHAAIERNDVNTGAVGGQMVPLGDRFVDAIRVLGGGSYLVAHNRVEVGYENAAGIRLQGSPTVPVADAVVIGNEIRMACAETASCGDESAGIEVRRAAVSNTIRANRIRGRARAALALVAEPTGAPHDTTFAGNNHAGFDPTLAHVYVGAGVTDTTVIGGHGSLLDYGTGTVVRGGYDEP